MRSVRFLLVFAWCVGFAGESALLAFRSAVEQTACDPASVACDSTPEQSGEAPEGAEEDAKHLVSAPTQPSLTVAMIGFTGRGVSARDERLPPPPPPPPNA